MTTDARLQIVGGGKMGQALAGGLVDSKWCQQHELLIVDPKPELETELSERFGLVAIAQTPAAGLDTILAVKPNLVETVCGQLKDPSRVMSIAAGITIGKLEAWLGVETAVIRAMPNTPALVGAGASGLAAGSAATADDVEWASSILNAVGETVVVPEAQLDALTALSGSGPGYFFYIAEEFIKAGVAAGLSQDVAAKLAKQTIYGAGKMMVETDFEPAELREAVTTPNGVTAAGLAVMRQRDLSGLLTEAVSEASKRSAQMGN